MEGRLSLLEESCSIIHTSFNSMKAVMESVDSRTVQVMKADKINTLN